MYNMVQAESNITKLQKLNINMDRASPTHKTIYSPVNNPLLRLEFCKLCRSRGKYFFGLY